MNFLGLFRQRRLQRTNDAKAQRILASVRAEAKKIADIWKAGLENAQHRMIAGALANGAAVPPRFPCHPDEIAAVLWRGGRIVSRPGAHICEPPPASLDVPLHMLAAAEVRTFRAIDKVVAHMIERERTERYVLQYVTRHEPRTAVYLHEAEAIGLKETAQ